MTDGLKKARLILKRYLTEASIHGLKYLVSGASVLSRILWAAAIVCCFSAALTSFMQALEDWNEVPLVTTIQSINQPIDSIPFPTVTVCSSITQNRKGDFQQYLFNGLKFACSGDDFDCKDTEPIRKVLRPLIRNLLEQLYEEKTGLWFSVLNPMLKEKKGSRLSNRIRQLSLGIDIEKVMQMMDHPTSKDSIFNELSDHIGKENLMPRFQPWLLLNQPEVTINQTVDASSMSKQIALEYVMRFIPTTAHMGLGDLLLELDPNRDQINISQLYDNVLDEIYISNNYSLKTVTKLIYNHGMMLDKYCSVSFISGTQSEEYQVQRCLNYQEFSSSLIMLISKYESGHHGFYDSPRRFLAKFNISDSLDGFLLKNDTPDFEWDPYSTMQFCKVTRTTVSQPKEENSCQEFLPIPTNNGICYAFNALHGFQMVNQSGIFHEAFTKSYHSEYHLYPNMDLPQKMAGDVKILSFWISDGNFNQPNEKPVEISISDVWNSFDFLSRSLQIEMGTDTVIYVQPITQVSIGIDHLPLETRKCRFNHEVIRDRLSIFGFYSFETCVYECTIAAAIEMCRCIPWNLAYSSRSATREVPICFDIASLHCVNQIMVESSNIQIVKDNRCLPDCNSIKFQVSHIDKNTLDMRSSCKAFDEDSFVGLNIKSTNLFTKTSLAKTSAVSIPSTICNSKMSQNYSRISVKMASHVFTQFKQTQRVDLHGKISQLGGTLGLFTGMSFLSLLEAIFWLLKFLPY